MICSCIVLDSRHGISIYFYSACIFFDGTGKEIEPKMSDYSYSPPLAIRAPVTGPSLTVGLSMVHKRSSMALSNQGHCNISMLSYWTNINSIPNEEGGLVLSICHPRPSCGEDSGHVAKDLPVVLCSGSWLGAPEPCLIRLLQMFKSSTLK